MVLILLDLAAFVTYFSSCLLYCMDFFLPCNCILYYPYGFLIFSSYHCNYALYTRLCSQSSLQHFPEKKNPEHFVVKRFTGHTYPIIKQYLPKKINRSMTGDRHFVRISSLGPYSYSSLIILNPDTLLFIQATLKAYTHI